MFICIIKNEDDSDVSKWTVKKYELFLKEHEASQIGNAETLQERCELLENLITKDLQVVVLLTIK